ncbi:hypothetical protein [Rhizobium binae]|uniref:hypothetical protein n=1 Tax=Rhizobium binae TaxID=1138190 RepID=UPI003DA7DDEF
MNVSSIKLAHEFSSFGRNKHQHSISSSENKSMKRCSRVSLGSTHLGNHVHPSFAELQARIERCLRQASLPRRNDISAPTDTTRSFEHCIGAFERLVAKSASQSRLGSKRPGSAFGLRALQMFI